MVSTVTKKPFYTRPWFLVIAGALGLVAVLLFALSGGNQQHSQTQTQAQPFQQEARVQPQAPDPVLSRLPAPRGQVVTGFTPGPTVCLGKTSPDLTRCKPNDRGGMDCPAKCDVPQ